MARVPEHPRLRGADHRLLKGYGPGVLLVVALLLAAFLAPTVQPEQNVTTGAAYQQQGVPAGSSATVPAGSTVPGAPAPSAGGAATGAKPGTAGTPGTPGAPGSAGTASQGLPPGTTSCQGRQVPNDPYSPPCLRWSGDNGGATSPGVTGSTIAVSLRELALPSIGNLVAQFDPGANIPDVTEAEVTQTITAFVNYFNTHFQFYGRKMVLKTFKGQGDLFTEVLGGGQAQANSDALTAKKQVGAFADILSLTAPYADALARQGVMTLNHLYFSQDWYHQQGLYAYSAIPDCTKVVAANVDFGIKLLKAQPNAVYAGGDLKGKPRKIALVVPNSPAYAQCAKQAEDELAAGGVHIADVETYPLTISSITNTTPKNLVDKLSGEGITTVVLATDPILPFFMTNLATQQNWYPEWMVTGVGLTDTDYIGQLYNQSEWSHAFGVSMLGAQVPDRASQAWAAYKQFGPPGTQMVPLMGQLIYQGLEMFALGIQEAGPDLTPQTFRQGLLRYPASAGEFGTWQFTQQDPYTPNVDERAIWWDPNARSSYDNTAGAYVSNGKRYPLGQLPSGPPPIFVNGPPG